jgi:hypothetical protein
MIKIQPTIKSIKIYEYILNKNNILCSVLSFSLRWESRSIFVLLETGNLKLETLTQYWIPAFARMTHDTIFVIKNTHYA